MRALVFLCSLLLAFSASAGRGGQVRNEQTGLDSVVALLHRTGVLILQHPQFAKRDSANTYFTEVLAAFLASKQGFQHPLDTVKNMIRLSDPKGEVVICTWQMPDADFAYQRYGIVAAKDKRGDLRVSVLQDKLQELGDDATFKVLKADKWFGALYYQLVPIKIEGEAAYTLLGYASGKDLNRKVVEVLRIDHRGKPRFGDKVFLIETFEDELFRRPPMRLILKYHPQHSASVKWMEKEEMIVMDHLAPPDAAFKGQYAKYGPDFSYDGLKWDDGWWKLEEQVRFNSGQNIQIRPPAPRDNGEANN